VAAPVEGGVGVPGEAGLVTTALGPGLGAATDEWVGAAPPTAGAGFATPPILFCGAFAPPSVLWAAAGETTEAESANAPASIHFVIIALFIAVPRMPFDRAIRNRIARASQALSRLFYGYCPVRPRNRMWCHDGVLAI
jgi:hypothetical protein